MDRGRRNVTQEAKSLLNCVRRLVRELRLSDRETQEHYGLSAAQVFVLHALREEDTLTVNDIADRTATDQSSASVVIQRLVDQRYIRRTVNPDDRRSVLLSLTKRGRTVMRKSPSTVQEKIFASVSKMTAGERAELLSLFKKFLLGLGVSPEAKVPMLFEDDPSAGGRAKRRRTAARSRL